MCSLSLRDFMPRPGLRLRGRVPKPPWWPPSHDRGAIGQTHRRGRGDSTPGGRDRRGAEPGPLGARGAGSLRPGAGLEPRTCAQAQPSRKSRVAGGWSRGCHPLPEDDAEAAGSRALWCAAGKEGRSRPPRWAVLLHRLAPPLPGCGPVSALAPPPGGPSHPGSERVLPGFPHPQQRSAAAGAPRRRPSIPAHTRGPAHASRPLLCQERRPPSPSLISELSPTGPPPESRPYATAHGAPSPALPCAQRISQESGLFVSGYGPLGTPLGPSHEHGR